MMWAAVSFELKVLLNVEFVANSHLVSLLVMQRCVIVCFPRMC
jgi:hypothetical protein